VTPLPAILVAILSASGAGRIAASLTAAEAPAGRAAPYARADLALTNATDASTEAVVLRPRGGGPGVRAALTVAPGQTGGTPVDLPAIWQAQTYDVTALGRRGEVLGTASAEIRWPGDRVATDAFLDGSYGLLRDAPARWPARTRRDALLLGAIVVLAAAATLLIRRPRLRAAAAIVVAGGASAGLFVGFIPSVDPGVAVQRYVLEIFDGRGGADRASFVALSARRTVGYEYRGRGAPHPVYPDRAAAAADGAVVDPAAGTIRMTLSPGRVRVIREGADPRPPANVPRGRVRAAEGALTVAWEGFARPVMVVRDDRVWPVDPSAGARELVLDPGRSLLIWTYLDSPPGRALSSRQRRLLEYWRQRHGSAGRVHVMAFGLAENVATLRVLRLGDPVETQPDPV